jgi:hypothetical protein
VSGTYQFTFTCTRLSRNNSIQGNTLQIFWKKSNIPQTKSTIFFLDENASTVPLSATYTQNVTAGDQVQIVQTIQDEVEIEIGYVFITIQLLKENP